MVTIKELSKASGLSVSTISKALNGYADINPETRRMVTELAEAHGYRPNPLARALRSGHSYNIGVLFMDDNSSGLRHPYFASVLDSFKVEAEKNGYDVTFINHNIGKTPMTYLEHCRYRKVDGLCLACVDFTAAEVSELIASDLPLVTIDHLFNDRACVQSENRQGVKTLVDYVCSMGHRQVAYVHGLKSAVTTARLTSFRKEMEARGLPVPPEYLIEAAYQNPAAAREAVQKLLKLRNPPTCVLLPDDYAALGALEALNAAGLQPGRDLSIAGFDGIELTQLISPRLTTIRQDTATIGRLAAERLVSLIERPDTTFQDILSVPTTLVRGETVASLL